MKNIKIKDSLNLLNRKNKNSTLNDNLKVGSVIYIQYLLLKEDEIKISNFIGLCVIKKKKSNTLVIKNTVKKEAVKLIVNTHSPLILKVKVLKRYKQKFRLSKLYYK